MLSPFDRVDGAPVSTLESLRGGLRLRHGRAAERRTEIHFGPGEISRLCLHRARLHTCERSKSRIPLLAAPGPASPYTWSYQLELDGLGPVPSRLKEKEPLQASRLTEPGALPPNH